MQAISRRNLMKLAMVVPAAYALEGRAQTWPDRPIRFVVGYPAGQSVDTIARRFAAVMAKDLGQPIIVDNRAGANGIIGAQDVKQSKPDGLTVLFATSGQLAINPSLYKTLPYDTLKDFAPVGRIITGPLFLVANPAFPPNNLQELIAYARARPGEIDYGSGGTGITAHLAMELLQDRVGIKLSHVPYKGTPAALNDVMGGQISLTMDSGPSAMPHVKSGKLKVLGTTGANRSPAFPDVPTFAEQGLAGFDVVAWNGVVIPQGTPAPIIAALSASLRKACSDPQLVEGISAMGIDLAPSSPAEFAAYLQAEIRKWQGTVAKAGVQLD